MAQKIYLVDDEQSVLDVLSTFLSRDGFEVTAFTDGEAMLARCESAMPDLVVLDVMMPGTDGLSVCSTLRGSHPHLPIILISAKDSPYDRVTGLTIGSDDYLSKPFLPIELVARVRALLRRSQLAPAEPEPVPELTFGPLTLHPGRRQAELDGESFPLTPTDFDFLAFLMMHEGGAVSREELLNHLWKVNWQADTRVADDLVKRLRKKLRARNSSVHIETIWGYGFRLALGDAE